MGNDVLMDLCVNVGAACHVAATSPTGESCNSVVQHTTHFCVNDCTHLLNSIKHLYLIVS